MINEELKRQTPDVECREHVVRGEDEGIRVWTYYGVR